MELRVEKDSLGEIKVPADKYWGAQTQRSRANFAIGQEKMPLEVIYGLAYVKKAAAIVNDELGLLDAKKRAWISEACDEILAGQLDDQFPLHIWQTGSGTQTNMNVNEVIANRAIEKAGGVKGSKAPVHPNDDVNRCQSTNDTFPTALHIASLLLLEKRLLPRLDTLLHELKNKSDSFSQIIKAGRTHLMDATPVTLGQVFSGFAQQVQNGIAAIHCALPRLREIALGGTAVGTGMNAHPEFAQKAAERLSKLVGTPLLSAPNKFEALGGRDAMVEVSGSLRRLAVSFNKMANDIRWMASGPRTGLNELILPANEPGSSIMPGKVNPTQCEALMMIAAQVMGNDVTIGIAGAQGNLELNVFMPVIGYNLLQSIHLLADGARNFTDRCLVGIEPNRAKIGDYLRHSLMLATALTPHIGYDKAAQIVNKAHDEHLTLKEAALALQFLSAAEFDRLVDPKKMVGPDLQ